MEKLLINVISNNHVQVSFSFNFPRNTRKLIITLPTSKETKFFHLSYHIKKLKLDLKLIMNIIKIIYILRFSSCAINVFKFCSNVSKFRLTL